MTNEIQLIQAPVIKHMLQVAGQNVTERIKALNLENQVATEETVKGLKSLRADLNKELTDYENQRKAIKEGVLNPYNEFEGIYKDEIATKYKAAIDLLKDKIALVEDKIKSEKKAELVEYFKELCTIENIDFLTFDRLAIDINLSTSLKAYKEQVNKYIIGVTDDLSLIRSEEFQAEILTEYKTTFNASKAITTVRERKEREKAEAERLRIAEVQRRIKTLVGLGFVYVDMTDSYEYDYEIFISKSEIEGLERNSFQTKVLTLEAVINEKQRAALAAKQAEQPIIPAPSAPAPVAAPVSAPSVVNNEPMMTASFTVSGTRAQLLALGAYMKANNITYKNI